MSILDGASRKLGKGFTWLWYNALVLTFLSGSALIFSQNGTNDSGSRVRSSLMDSGLRDHSQMEDWMRKYQVEKDSGNYEAALFHLENAYENLQQLHQGENTALTHSSRKSAMQSEGTGMFLLPNAQNAFRIYPFLLGIIFLLSVVLIWQQVKIKKLFQRLVMISKIPDEKRVGINIPENAGTIYASMVRKDDGHAWLELVSTVALEQLNDPLFSLDRWSEALRISPRQFQRRLKAATGLTVSAYLHELRLQHARELLDRDQFQSARNLATAVGMRDPKYFSREFKKRFGQTPLKYQLSLQEK